MRTNKWLGIAGNWSDGTKWSAGTKPATGDDIVYDTGSGNCTVDETPATGLNTFTIAVGYTGTFNDGGFAFNIVSTVSVTPGGTFTASGTWTQTGDANWTYANSGTYNVATQNVVLQGTGTFTISKYSCFVYNMTIAASGKVTTTAGVAGYSGWKGLLTVGTGQWNINTFTYGGILSDFLSINASATLNGAYCNLYISPRGSGTYNIPALNLTGNNSALYMPGYYSSGTLIFNFQGNITMSGILYLFEASSANSITYTTNDFSISCTTLNTGSSSGAYTSTYNFGHSSITITKFNQYFAVGTTIYNMSTSVWSCGGDWVWKTGGTTTVNHTSDSVTITNTSQITSIGKPFYDLTINASTKTITLADALTTAAGGDLTITAGTLNTATYAVTVGMDFTVAGTSTYTGTSTALSVAGSMTLSATCTFTITSASLTLNGTSGTQTITTNGKTLPNTTHNGSGGTVQLADTATFGTLTLTAGAFSQNSVAVTCSGLIWNTLTTSTFNGTMTCSGSVSIGASAAGTITNTWTLTGTGAISITTNGKALSTLTINNAAGTFTLQDALSCGLLTITAGAFVQNTKGITCAGITINSAQVVTLDASISSNGNITLGASSNITHSGASITTTSTGTSIVTNGKSLPTMILTKGASFTGSSTIYRLKMVGGYTYYFDYQGTYTILIYNSGDWSGTAYSLYVTLRTNSFGNQTTFVAPAGVIVGFCDIQDNKNTGTLIDASDPDNINSFNNSGWAFTIYYYPEVYVLTSKTPVTWKGVAVKTVLS